MEPKIPTTIEIRNIIEKIEEEEYRYAFMYQFLIGGEVAEASGKYAPEGKDAHRVEFEIRGIKFPAVLFIVKNIKPKHRGKFRVCAIPLDSEFEHWAEPLYNWFVNHRDECPFIFSKKEFKAGRNQRYYQWKAEEIFNDLMWYKEGYVKNGKKVERRLNPFRASDIRDLRRKNLKDFYLFDELDLAIFGAWKEPVIDLHLKSDIEQIFLTEIPTGNIMSLKKIAKKYFEKLLMPIEDLGKEKEPIHLLIRNYADLLKKYKRAREIIELVQNINILGEGKLSAPFFKENMMLILEILSPCNIRAQFTSKIASLATLFEVDIKPLLELVKRPKVIGSIKLIETWLHENEIAYDPNIIRTLLNVKTLRNMEPIHSKTDPKKFLKILDYFGEPMSLPPNYSNLWDKILDKFNFSLKQIQEILNEFIPIKSI